MGFMPNNCRAKWAYYWMTVMDLGELANPGAVPSVNEGQLRDVLVPVPPQDEQEVIASFLDRQTAWIDDLIAKKQRQIELLEEKRAALISYVVTKGLDRSVPMKDSGVEWIGEIPEHWSVMGLGRLAVSLQTGPFGSQLHAAEYVEGGIPVINPANIADGEIVPDSMCAISKVKFNELSRHRLAADDIIFARRGEMGRCARVTETTEGFLCGTGCLRVRLSTGTVESCYVSLFLSTPGLHDYFLLESIGSTMDNLNTGILARTPIAVPPREEQVAIAGYVASEMSLTKTITERVLLSIAMLREYRTAMISAAVTGRFNIQEGEV